MNRTVRLIFYLVLNIIVSASVTLAVLWWWDHRSSSLPSIPFLSPTPISTSAPIQPTDEPQPINHVTVQVPPVEQIVIEIQNVFGAGDLTTEVVVFKRKGEGNLNLTNWRLKDEDGHTYTFPDVTLNQNESLQLFTKAGSNSPIALYWGLNEATWRIGETVRLLDPLGNERAVYQIR